MLITKIKEKKSIVLLCVAIFILVLGTGTVAPLLSSHAKSMGANGLWIGLIFSGFYVIRMLLGVPIGSLGDKKGAKKMLSYSLMLYPFIAFTYWVAGNLYIFFLARMLHGVASVMMLPMAMSYIGQISPEGKESQYLGIYNMTVLFANAIGPVLGGTIADNMDISYAFGCLFIFAILAFFVIVMLPDLKKGDDKRENSGEATQENTGEAVSVEKNEGNKGMPWKNPQVLAVGGINIFMAVLSIFMISFFTLFVKEKNFGFFSVGFLITLNNITCGILQVPFGKIADKSNGFVLICIATLIMAGVLFIFPVIETFWMMAVGIVFLGVSSGMVLAVSSGLSASLGKKFRMSSVMGFLGAATSFGMIIGPLISGFISDNFEVKTTFYFVAWMCLIGLALFAMLWAFSKNKQKIAVRG